jgi:cell division protein FtsW
MGVNVGLLPAKGMTLPMISAGGSSLIAVSITFGMLLGLTRRHSAISDDMRLPEVGVGGAGYEFEARQR